ncbi:CCA tRNA nucleotidyltransferase [Oscillibacter valericigenes]|nr:CCA tRNA nucleotidyltransferase [Oscillibacter valericigenes]
MTEKIPQPVREMLALLRENGHAPYLVGGCVRDLLRGAAPDDYDMTSGALPEEVMELFGAAAHPTGLAHGTVTLVRGGVAVEHTTERRDGAYHDSRHPESVTFTDRIEDDLARRDFTVNAIALSPTGELVDPFGGQADLRAGVLRCVGEPERRFAEDALRILRLLRFASVLGFSVERETAIAARARKDGLRAIAHERVYAELNKLLCGEYVTTVLLSYPDILGVVLPELLPCVGFDQRNPHHCYDVWEHTARSVGAAPPTRVLRWTMLLHDLGKPSCFTQDADGIGHFYGHTAISAQLAEGVMARLHFEHALAQGVRAQLTCFDEMFPPERAAVHRLMARYGRETVWSLLQTKLADNAAKAPAGLERAQKPWREALLLYDELTAENACCSLAELNISGDDLLAIGFSGRSVGQAKKRLLDEVAAEKLENDRDALMHRAERLYRSGWRGDGKE